jgi:hypothetical protein
MFNLFIISRKNDLQKLIIFIEILSDRPDRAQIYQMIKINLLLMSPVSDCSAFELPLALANGLPLPVERTLVQINWAKAPAFSKL